MEGYLALTDLGEFQVKGASRPLRVHELTGVGAARGRLDVSRARGFSRFVGRDEELRILESALEQAFAGQGQVIGIVGEAGVGKSRLCHEFAERRRAKGIPVYHVAGQAHAKSVPLLPVLQFLRTYFEITERDSDRTARERIAGKLLLLDKSFDDDLPLIFDFLAVPDPERPPPRMDPEARQRQLLGLMKRLTHAESAREPGVVVFEDLHWLDPASEVFLANQVEAVQGTRSLIVLNFRPEYHAPWMSRSYYRQIALAPLGPEAIEQLLAELLGSDPSLDGLAELVRERTEGNPFFIEELVQALVEAGSLEGERGAYRLVGPVEEAAVPASVQAVLAARIDRLGQREKAVLQAAAVIGKEFPAPVLERVVELEPAELEDALRNLVAGEFVYEQELYPEALYAFKHPLTQEVAYGSQLGERRATVHAAVARAIAEQYPERLDERAALLAQHWEAAGETLEAARWHARAAAWSGTGDPTQALRHWRKVRELADALPESEETVALGLDGEDLAAELRLAPRDLARRGGGRVQRGGADGLEGRGHPLAGDPALELRGASGAWATATCASSPGSPARRSRSPRSPATRRSTWPSRPRPTPSSASASTARPWRSAIARSSWRTATPPWEPASTCGCPYACCHGIKGLNLVNLGELEEARRLIEQGRKIAREQGDIEVVGFSHMWSAWLAYFQGEPEAALGHAQQALEIAERIGGSFSRAWAWFCLGLAERMRGEWRRAIEALERSVAIARESRTAVEGDALRLALLGESYLGLGDLERARALVEEGLEIARAQRDTVPTEITCEPGAGAGPARLGRPRRACGDRGGARARARAGARHGREGVRAAGPRRARRAGAPERRRGGARARAPRGAPPLHGDRRERPCRAPRARAGDRRIRTVLAVERRLRDRGRVLRVHPSPGGGPARGAPCAPPARGAARDRGRSRAPACPGR